MRNLRTPLLSLAVLAVGCAPPQAPQPQIGATAAPTTAPSVQPTEAPAAAAFTLTGKIFDDDLGAVDGATVRAWADGAEKATATTGADGVYRLGLPAGTYRVVAEKAGWTTREQTVSLGADATLNFGGPAGNQENPFFLSDTPEISQVTIDEKAAGGPLVIRATMSEPLPEASRKAFIEHFRLEASGREFLRAENPLEAYLATKASWDEAGRVFTLEYAEPYLASGTSNVNFAILLEQDMLDTVDPVTRENEWQDLGVQDAEGHALGKGRADYAFLRDQLTPLPLIELADKTFGYTPELRRWNLTHRGPYTFTAKADTTPPELVSAQVRKKVTFSGKDYDLVELRFSEPMRVVRNAEEEQFTRLDKEKEIAIINVAASSDGASPQPLSTGLLLQELRFSRVEPNVVLLYYPLDTFKNKNWVEVTLGRDVADPAGNKPGTDKIKAVWRN